MAAVNILTYAVMSSRTLFAPISGPSSYMPLSLFSYTRRVSGRSRQLSRYSEQRSDRRGQRWAGRLLRPGHRQRRYPQQKRQLRPDCGTHDIQMFYLKPLLSFVF